MSEPLGLVYIAGPMTGYPEYNAAAFRAAQQAWRERGWDAITPFDTNSVVWRRHYGRDFDPATDVCDYGDPILAEMLLEDFRAIYDAQVVAFLPGWQRSRGATLEHTIATTMGRRLADAETGEALRDESCLLEAERLVGGDRQSAYGHPIEDFTRTGRMWGAILGTADVSPDKVALCMVALKVSRECHKPKRDNITDMAGYAKTLELVRERQADQRSTP